MSDSSLLAMEPASFAHPQSEASYKLCSYFQIPDEDWPTRKSSPSAVFISPAPSGVKYILSYFLKIKTVILELHDFQRLGGLSLHVSSLPVCYVNSCLCIFSLYNRFDFSLFFFLMLFPKLRTWNVLNFLAVSKFWLSIYSLLLSLLFQYILSCILSLVLIINVISHFLSVLIWCRYLPEPFVFLQFWNLDLLFSELLI